MFNQLYPLWKATTLSTRVKLKIFRVSVGMMARHGSEARTLNEKTLKKMRGWCSSCLVFVTGRTHRKEAGTDSSFDVTATIRAQRLKHLGNILRLSDDESLKIVVTKFTKTEDGTCPAGSMFMDPPEHVDMQQLCDFANDTAGCAKNINDTFLPGEEGQRKRRRAAQLIRIQLTFFSY